MTHLALLVEHVAYWVALVVASVGIVVWCAVSVSIAAERRRARHDPAGLVALSVLLRHASSAGRASREVDAVGGIEPGEAGSDPRRRPVYPSRFARRSGRVG